MEHGRGDVPDRHPLETGPRMTGHDDDRLRVTLSDRRDLRGRIARGHERLDAQSFDPVRQAGQILVDLEVVLDPGVDRLLGAQPHGELRGRFDDGEHQHLPVDPACQRRGDRQGAFRIGCCVQGHDDSGHHSPAPLNGRL
jgi:hypothetical protein